jgi:hypothetical protein
MRILRVCVLAGMAAWAVSMGPPKAWAGGIAPAITIINTAPGGDGYTFTNFDGPVAATTAGNGTTMNGISNTGVAVGFSTPDGATLTNFTAHPLTSTAANVLNINGSTAAMALGINSAGTTFVFSQILGINDHGLAVGYYGDSTGSQHGFLYNTLTGQYTFLDDPDARIDPNLGTVITQITGINNNDEITGFYSDANGVFHGFLATVPEPGSMVLMGLGLAGVAAFARHRSSRALRQLASQPARGD